MTVAILQRKREGSLIGGDQTVTDRDRRRSLCIQLERIRQCDVGWADPDHGLVSRRKDHGMGLHDSDLEALVLQDRNRSDADKRGLDHLPRLLGPEHDRQVGLEPPDRQARTLGGGSVSRREAWVASVLRHEPGEVCLQQATVRLAEVDRLPHEVVRREEVLEPITVDICDPAVHEEPRFDVEFRDPVARSLDPTTGVRLDRDRATKAPAGPRGAAGSRRARGWPG